MLQRLGATGVMTPATDHETCPTSIATPTGTATDTTDQARDTTQPFDGALVASVEWRPAHQGTAARLAGLLTAPAQSPVDGERDESADTRRPVLPSLDRRAG